MTNGSLLIQTRKLNIRAFYVGYHAQFAVSSGHQLSQNILWNTFSRLATQDVLHCTLKNADRTGIQQYCCRKEIKDSQYGLVKSNKHCSAFTFLQHSKTHSCFMQVVIQGKLPACILPLLKTKVQSTSYIQVQDKKIFFYKAGNRKIKCQSCLSIFKCKSRKLQATLAASEYTKAM